MIWGHDAVSVIWGYENEFKEGITLYPHNKVIFYMLEFHNPQEINCILLDSSAEGTPDGETHRWPHQIMWMHVDENTNNALCGHRSIFPILYFTFSTPTRTSLVSRMIVMTGSRLLQQHPHFLSSLYTWVHRPWLLEFAVDVDIHIKYRLGHLQQVDEFVRVVKESTPHVIDMEKIDGPCHLVPEIWAVTGNGSIWSIHNQLDLNTYWDV